MSALPLKPTYGPTLGQLLAPRWHATRLAARVAVLACVVAVSAGVVGVVLTLAAASYSQSSPIAFHFYYKDLYRTTPDPGGYVKVQSGSGGRLMSSFAVGPLHLPPYHGALNGFLPVYAAGYIDSLARRDPDFDLLGEGRVRVNTVPGYAIQYTERLHGELLDGRDVLLVRPAQGERDGVDIVMLTRASDAITALAPVATDGPLHRALRSFKFG